MLSPRIGEPPHHSFRCPGSVNPFAIHLAAIVLDNVDLSLREGDIVGLLGRSGSGKSTLLRIIAGLIKPTAGTVTFGGQLVAGPCKGVAMVFQSFALFPWLTQGTARPDPQAGFDGLPAGQG
jgi:NitT/TauT family transport system ATP-binding protein